MTNAPLNPQRAAPCPRRSRQAGSGGGGRGQSPQPLVGRRRPSQAVAARRRRRLPHAGKPHPAAPPERGGVLGTPKESHLAPHPPWGHPHILFAAAFNASEDRYHILSQIILFFSILIWQFQTSKQPNF
ncbi:hypothetical protein AAES_153929 [Amazona aestiva]|uniref:Uncharacterized protein n=1 Tax=Amazona aestiva TaxID=12930 RepID=A0A0Q3PEI4_AMAAE|nr:hypothetical protein AAES_153929 [Amazona aestiva]